MRKVWIEVALNGPWTRGLQPGIPDTIDTIIAEGIACARAGAAIIHAHAYDGGGPPTCSGFCCCFDNYTVFLDDHSIAPDHVA